MVPFRGKILLKPRPDWYLLGVNSKFSDEHPRPFYMRIPPRSVRLHTDLKLTIHESLLLYIPSNDAGKNIISKSFNILNSDPVRSRVEGSPAFSRYPARANFPYISLENSSNRFYTKHRLGSAGTRRATRLAGPLAFEGRVTLLPGKTFCHACIHFGSPTRVNCRCTGTDGQM